MAIAPRTPKPRSRAGKVAIAGTASAALLVAVVGGFEGLRLDAYKDVVGIPTICYGETQGVKLGDSLTKAECDAMFVQRLIQFENELDACIDPPFQIPVETKIALVSWAYNVGSFAACRSTLARLVRQGDYEGACNQLPRWVRAGGRTIRGLVIRRNAERALCFEGLSKNETV